MLRNRDKRKMRKQAQKRKPADDYPATLEELLARIGREQRKGEK